MDKGKARLSSLSSSSLPAPARLPVLVLCVRSATAMAGGVSVLSEPGWEVWLVPRSV